MKKFSALVLVILMASMVFAQQTGYYNGTDGKNGEELKTALNDIIKGHTPYSYFFSKEIFKLSDVDPENPDNVIQVYTGFSHPNGDYGNSGLQLNREHVWAKSHGNFADLPPMYGDVHNLKPSASSVNQDKSNLDFDNGGIQHDIATGCYFTDTTWEARDEVKGDIARIIFYMATRYEGNDGEMDLEVVDHNHTYPLPQHGKLSTLLEWNEQDPPDAFERNRNNVIFQFQKNRNPFIDNPEFVQLIWGEVSPNPISIDDVQMLPQIAVAEEPVSIKATITSITNGEVTASIFWGLSFDDLTNEIQMSASGDEFSADIPGQEEDATIYYKIVATDGEFEHATVVYNYYVPKVFNGTLVSIYDIQGQQDESPYNEQIVSTSGIVTGNFGDNYYIQDGSGEWNGLFIYESGRNPSVGDSVIITGEIDEYYGKTELKNVTDYYFISGNNTLPDPVVVQTGNVSEGYESVLVKVNNALCTDDNYQANFFMWTVNDGSGDLRIHNTAVFEYDPSQGEYYTVVGPMNYDFDEWKIELRFESDVMSGGDTDGPVLVEVTPVINTNIKIIFNEDVEESSAETISNYTVDNGITVEAAMQHAFNKSQVNLTVTPLNGDYELTVQNVEDTFGNVMELQNFSFSYVGIEELLQNGQMKVYPNPASEQIHIAFDAIEDFEIEIVIMDITGKQIISDTYMAGTGANKISYDFSGFSKGMYLLNIMSEKGKLNYKLIVK
ncbi:MAG: endonuclease [Bacteroidetes bacterium]|nr:endonuclease [Bacteroidota bacterium]